MIKNAYFAAGCFWGVEHKFQNLDGVLEAISGYSGGKTLNPTYKLVCEGNTGHAETVKVIYDQSKISFLDLCKFFFGASSNTRIPKATVFSIFISAIAFRFSPTVKS